MEPPFFKILIVKLHGTLRILNNRSRITVLEGLIVILSCLERRILVHWEVLKHVYLSEIVINLPNRSVGKEIQVGGFWPLQLFRSNLNFTKPLALQVSVSGPTYRRFLPYLVTDKVRDDQEGCGPLVPG